MLNGHYDALIEQILMLIMIKKLFIINDQDQIVQKINSKVRKGSHHLNVILLLIL